MWYNKIFKESLLKVFIGIIQLVLGLLALGPIVTGNFNIWVFLSGISIQISCLIGMGIMSMEIIQEDNNDR
jgi:hypothetical protein